MHVDSISLQHFRNIPFARLNFSSGRNFLLGANAQGKTSLLEALALMTALRSFRQQEASAWITHGQNEARILYHLHQEALGNCTLELRIKPKSKQVLLNDTPCSKFSDFFGLFPTIILSNQDSAFLRGAPALRRRLLDFSLAAVDASYLQALKTYHTALGERNALLRSSKTALLFNAYEALMAQSAPILIKKRLEALCMLEHYMISFYQKLSGHPEEALCFLYKNSIKKEGTPPLRRENYHSPDSYPDPYFVKLSQEAASRDEESWKKLWAKHRERDGLLKATQEGPHRDDFEVYIQGKLAKDYASEGQQRCAVLALKLAQGAFFEQKAKTVPLVLIDDVLGELDPQRQARFWEALGSRHQVISTGTTVPAGIDLWSCIAVSQGTFTPISLAN